MVLYNFIKYLWLSIKYNKILNKVYKEENLLQNLSHLLGVEMKQDWIGRIYTIFNPHIVDGKYNENIFEFGSDKPTRILVEKYIMERLNIADKFIHANNLFDLLTYEIKQLDEYDNFLFVMYPIPYASLKDYAKKFSLIYIPLIILSVILLTLI